MNSICEQNNSLSMQTGMIPYGAAMPDMGGGDSLFQLAWRGKWLIMISVIAATAAAWLYLQYATKTYESSSSLLVDKPAPRPDSDVPRPVGSTLTNYLATQAHLLTSPEIVRMALSDPNWLMLPRFSDPNYMGKLIGSLSAEVAKKADIIEVKASSAYAEDAAGIVNAVVNAYIKWHEVNRQLTTADLLKESNTQLKNCYDDLQRKRKEQTVFEKSHPEVLESTPGGMISRAMESLRSELVAARLKVVERDSYYQVLQRLEKKPDAFREYVYSHPISTAAVSLAATVAAGEQNERIHLQRELERIRFQLQDMRAMRAVRTADALVLQNRQSELEKQIAEFDEEFVKQQLALARTLLEDATDQREKITELYEREFATVQNLSEQGAQYTSLKSECEMIEKLYNTLLDQINKLDLNARFEGLQIHVLGRAVPAKRPSWPQTTSVVGIALVLGLMLGGGLVVLRDWTDQTVRSADEITGILGVPILGAVPTIPRRGLLPRRSRSRLAASSRESESFRSIRTALFFGPSSDGIKTLLVTSPGSLEGKTTLVGNLGIVMAHAGQKTLIIDADLRKPMQHRVFAKGSHNRGLVDVLVGTTPVEEAIRATEIKGLDVLECGQAVSNPSELLSSDAFANLLEQLAGRYDRILVDSPPVGIVADAQILAVQCGWTLLVLRAQKSSRIVTQRARDALFTVSAKVVGAVVNDVAKGDPRYSHYGSGAYSYYYGAQSSNARQAVRGELPGGDSPQARAGDRGPADR